MPRLSDYPICQTCGLDFRYLGAPSMPPPSQLPPRQSVYGAPQQSQVPFQAQVAALGEANTPDSMPAPPQASAEAAAAAPPAPAGAPGSDAATASWTPPGPGAYGPYPAIPQWMVPPAYVGYQYVTARPHVRVRRTPLLAGLGAVALIVVVCVAALGLGVLGGNGTSTSTAPAPPKIGRWEGSPGLTFYSVGGGITFWDMTVPFGGSTCHITVADIPVGSDGTIGYDLGTSSSDRGDISGMFYGTTASGTYHITRCGFFTSPFGGDQTASWSAEWTSNN